MQSEITHFLIVSPERSGSNLLGEVVGSHCSALFFGEPFNPDFLRRGVFPERMQWMDEQETLADLRASDIAGFYAAATEQAAQRGYTAIGSKLLYSHIDHTPDLCSYLKSAANLHILRLRRRNLLRRLVSERRAQVTGEWWRRKGTIPGTPLPRVTLSVSDCMRDFAAQEARQAEYAPLFKNHRVLDMIYEELALDPQSEAVRAQRFLGLSTDVQPTIWSEKTGLDTLREAIANYDELQPSLIAAEPSYAAFFDD